MQENLVLFCQDAFENLGLITVSFVILLNSVLHTVRTIWTKRIFPLWSFYICILKESNESGIKVSLWQISYDHKCKYCVSGPIYKVILPP